MKTRKVFCEGCANLFFVGGKSSPLCVATAVFKDGPLRERVDVEGVVYAEPRNHKNDCKEYTYVSLRAWELKRWLLWRLNDGIKEGKQRAITRGLREYPVSVEAERKLRRVEEPPKRGFAETEEEGLDEDHDSGDQETIFIDGGVGGDEQSGSDDTDGGEVLQDA